MACVTALLLATLQVWASLDLSAGMVGGQVGETPKCCSSLTAMDTILGMMQGYKDEVTKLNARVAQLESGGQQHVPPKTPDSNVVAFYAQLSHPMGNIKRHQSVIFDNVITNEGSGYNNATGVFTCEEPGVYVFFLNVMTLYNKYVEVELIKNGDRFLIQYSSDASGFDNGSNLGVIRLAKGDTVWARVHWHNDKDKEDVMRPLWTTFSGFLLNSV